MLAKLGLDDSETRKQYAINAVFGIQHMFAMMGANILIPIVCGLNPSIALLASGLGTIIFHFIAKRKVPVYLGSSGAFISAILSITAYGARKGLTRDETLGRQMVAVIISGILYFLFAAIARFAGPQRIQRLFPPIVVGPIVVVIGLTLAATVISSYIVQCYTPDAAGEAPMKAYAVWVTALVTAVVIVCMSLFARGLLKSLPVLFGIIAGYICGACFGIIDYSVITGAPWVIFEPAAARSLFGFYRHIKWDWSVIAMLSPLSIVTLMEHFGDITTNGAVVGCDFFDDPGADCTLLGDGIAVCIAGFLGGLPVTTYSENTGVLALTRNYNPKILVIAASYAIALGIFTKFGGVLTSVPGPVIGGASIILFGTVTAMGLKVLVDQRVDFTQQRNLVIVAVVLVFGIGFSAAGVDAHIAEIAISPLAIATVSGVLLNLVLKEPKKSDEQDGDGTAKKKEAFDDNEEIESSPGSHDVQA
jgi:uracil permease